MKQTELAGRMVARGYKTWKQQTIDRIERGERKRPEDEPTKRKVTYGEAVDLAACLGYTPETLVSGGNELLLQQGAAVDVRMHDLLRASREYVEAMMRYAKGADDRADDLHDNVRQFLDDALRLQTPPMLVRDGYGVLDAAMSRNGIEPGPRVQEFRAALKRDFDILEAQADASL